MIRTQMLLDAALQAASSKDIAGPIAKLMVAFPPPSASMGDAKAKLFLSVLAGFPAWAIRESVDRFIMGEVPGASLEFAPTPAALRTAVEAAVRPLKFQRWEVGKALSAEIGP